MQLPIQLDVIPCHTYSTEAISVNTVITLRANMKAAYRLCKCGIRICNKKERPTKRQVLPKNIQLVTIKFQWATSLPLRVTSVSVRDTSFPLLSVSQHSSCPESVGGVLQQPSSCPSLSSCWWISSQDRLKWWVFSWGTFGPLLQW